MVPTLTPPAQRDGSNTVQRRTDQLLRSWSKLSEVSETHEIKVTDENHVTSLPTGSQRP